MVCVQIVLFLIWHTMFIIIMLGDRGGGETMKLIIIYPESLPLTLPLRFNYVVYLSPPA